MKIHPRHHVLEGFLARLVPEARLLVRHLLGCRRCRTAALVVLERLSDDTADDQVLSWPGPTESFVSEELLKKLVKRRGEFARERALAPTLVAEILGCLPTDRRRRIVERERFHTAAFVVQVLEEGRQRLEERPFDGLELIQLGREAAERLDPDIYGERILRDLQARAWAYAGDAHRRCGDLPEAERALLEAEVLLADTGDPLEEARFLQLKAALLRDQRFFRDSRRLQQRARRELQRCHQVGLE